MKRGRPFSAGLGALSLSPISGDCIAEATKFCRTRITAPHRRCCSAELHSPFRWELKVVAGVGHDAEGMGSAAFTAWFGQSQ
eukprot:SAG11_NODE_2482_length_3305_cov_1.521210_4_plen_82_part_00